MRVRKALFLAGGGVGLTAVVLLFVLILRPSAVTFVGHTALVHLTVPSPDGKTLATVSQDRTIRLWDMTTGRQRFVLRGHSGDVWSVAFSPASALLASAGDQDQLIRLWNTTTGTQVATLQGHSASVSSVAFSGDGTLLASGSFDGTVKLWDVAAAKLRMTLRGHGHWVNSVAFSPDGQTVASASFDKTVKLWDVVTGEEQATLRGHQGSVLSLAFSPDGKTLVSADFHKTVKMWDVTARKERYFDDGYLDGDYLKSIAFSPDGKTMALSSDEETIGLWDVASGKNTAILEPGRRPQLWIAETVLKTLCGRAEEPGLMLKAIVFTPLGHLMALGSDGPGYQTVKLWRIASVAD